MSNIQTYIEPTSQLKAELVEAGADDDTIAIADIEEMAISYMADESTRIRVKMVGNLSFAARKST